MSDPKVNIDTAKVNAALEAALNEALNVSYLAISRLVRGKLSQAGTGRIYRISAGKKTGRNLRAQGFHRASAPGFPPAVNTNRLRASFMTDQLGTWKYGYAFIKKAPGRMTLNYGSKVVYAPVLEFGDRRGRIKPRPYLRPSMQAFTKQMPRIFQTAFKRHFGVN